MRSSWSKIKVLLYVWDKIFSSQKLANLQFISNCLYKNYNDEKNKWTIDHKENFLNLLTVFLKCATADWFALWDQAGFYFLFVSSIFLYKKKNGALWPL